MSEQTFQQRVQPWLMECFGPMIAGDREERNHRFLEEALELVQACGATASEAHQLVDYVYGRPVGEKKQETGGVMVTLAALCLANDMDMHEASEAELARIWTKVEQIRAKQAAKPKHSPLPAAALVATQEPMTGAKLAEGMALTGMDFQFLPINPEVPRGDRCAYTLGSAPLYKLAEAVNAVMTQPAPAQEPDEPCDNCGLGHPSSNCIYKPAQDKPTPPSRAAFIAELESTAQNLLLDEDAVGAERVRHAAHLLRTAPTGTWKVLPSPASVTGAMLIAAWPGADIDPGEYHRHRKIWDDYAERVSARLAAPVDESTKTRRNSPDEINNLHKQVDASGGEPQGEIK